jgi:hypothetical protein
VAVGISADLVHQGVVDLKGYGVTSAEDLAKLTQVYRDHLAEAIIIHPSALSFFAVEAVHDAVETQGKSSWPKSFTRC